MIIKKGKIPYNFNGKYVLVHHDESISLHRIFRIIIEQYTIKSLTYFQSRCNIHCHYYRTTHSLSLIFLRDDAAGIPPNEPEMR